VRKKNEKVYIIAEIGINHNGDLNNCYRLIDIAADAGCDCVKFQFFKASRLYPRSAGKLDWKDRDTRYRYDIYNAVKSFEFPATWVKLIKRYCKLRKIDFLSSVFDIKGADYLIRQGMKMIKLPSFAVTNIPLVEHCARYNMPIIMSTGGATLGEIEDAVRTVNKHHNRLSLLHCSIKYPTKLSECNLGVIKTLQYTFPKNSIGYSDHTKEVSCASVQAVYLGAEIIEKHITLDRDMSGPDHFFALEPRGLKKMIPDVNRAREKYLKKAKVKIDKKIYGFSGKITFKHERYMRDFCFATIFAKRNIRQGAKIRCKDLIILRPGKKERGLEPKYIDLFKKHDIYSARDIAREDAITWEKIFNA
jgi:N-acetylneuraminate synthase